MFWCRGPEGKHTHQRRQSAISRSVACEESPRVIPPAIARRSSPPICAIKIGRAVAFRRHGHGDVVHQPTRALRIAQLTPQRHCQGPPPPAYGVSCGTLRSSGSSARHPRGCSSSWVDSPLLGTNATRLLLLVLHDFRGARV